MKFDTEIQKILEDFNIYPRARAVQGRQAPVPSTNVDSAGPQPMGFKGSGPSGIGPSAMSTILLELPKKKKKKFKKKK
jgi:hypothetical protein